MFEYKNVLELKTVFEFLNIFEFIGMLEPKNILEFILAYAGSFFAALLFNVKRSNLIWSGLSGMVGWMAYSSILGYSSNTIIPTFIGAVAVGIYSEIMARVIKVPATIFSISGIFPIVPGIAAYNTIQSIVDNNLSQAGAKAVETITSAGALAFGIMMVTAFFRFSGSKRTKKELSRK